MKKLFGVLIALALIVGCVLLLQPTQAEAASVSDLTFGRGDDGNYFVAD